jgi:glutamine synthetase
VNPRYTALFKFLASPSEGKSTLAAKRVTELYTADFAKNVFSESSLKSYISPRLFHEYLAAKAKNVPLTGELADGYAHALREWAAANGATHFTHIFQPIMNSGNVLTAEKHDSFLSFKGPLMILALF